MAPWRRRRRIKDRALPFQRAFEDRLAGRTEPFDGGVAIFRPELPRVFDLNFLRVHEAPAGGAGALAELADRIQGDAGLLHRRVVVDDEAAGEGMIEDFRRLGWLADHMLLMALASPPPLAIEPPAELAEPGELLPAQEQQILSDPHDRSPEVVQQLLAAEGVRAGAVPTRALVVRAEGEVASWCLLYTADGMSQIDEVTTLQPHRRRGYGTAVVQAAIAQAGAERCDWAFLWADERDWPWRWYASLGFEPVARRYAFVRRP
jgi:GNAT superfamily N-acetyltransferase